MKQAMFTALNQAPENELHDKGALNNGVTVGEIKTALLHPTGFCGIPAGLDAFRAAHEVLATVGASSKLCARITERSVASTLCKLLKERVNDTITLLAADVQLQCIADVRDPRWVSSRPTDRRANRLFG